MKHRLSAGAIIIQNGRVLLVHCRREGRYDFWVAPGGGIEGTESLEQAVEREVYEEVGLQVKPSRLLYIEEFYDHETRYCKFWFEAEVIGGNINTTSASSAAEYIVEAEWFAWESLNTEQVYPMVLRTELWNDLEAGGPFPRRLALREMLVR